MVKTRLAAGVGPAKALEVYRSLVEIACRALASFEGVEIRFTPDDSAKEIRHWMRQHWRMNPQGKGDLGDRLCRAFDESFAERFERIVIIGSDCPTITPQDLSSAFAALNNVDMVYGPATDGGYWLIGLKHACPALFEDVRWSTEQTLEDTLANAGKLGLTTSPLRILSDIDTVEDLEIWNQTQRQ